MNVLILTPDRVGSTLLQRLITVYMNFHSFDRPVINLHELTNGLMQYYSPEFNQEVLGKPTDRPWGYYQTLEQITDLLQTSTHYKTSRLAHYHIIRRGDSLAQQVPFYQYLNDNFFIISAQRQNLLEHTLSWCISLHSKKLNVYNHQEKLHSFYNIYRNKISVDLHSVQKYLNDYKNYLQWVQDHFTVSSYFEYEKHLCNIEQYILDLDIFHNQRKKDWHDTFGIAFADWNRCHYLVSDISGLGLQLELDHAGSVPQLSYQSQAQLELRPTVTKSTVPMNLSAADKQFLKQHASHYMDTDRAIQDLVTRKVLITGIPIKLQTMLEKKLIIKNFDQCVEIYNDWVSKNNLGEPYLPSTIMQLALDEVTKWHATAQLT